MNAPIQLTLSRPGGDIVVYLQGDHGAPVVLMTHSILSSSMMWQQQSTLLAQRGFRVVCVDTRGHGASQAPSGPCTMDDLAADSVGVLDSLEIERRTTSGCRWAA
jgi:3-oxoadipate enol-lactonase